ncbi:hypothetical protein LP420_40490 [Massilia sp. B-10]|nr:hypothetical protein LP420_40490 [Massilia sp. B-10]
MRARPLLEQAAADDETRVGAWMQLSLSAQAGADLDGARNWAERAARAALAWPVPLARMAVLAKARGDTAALAELTSVQEKLLRRIENVGIRLST